MRVLIIGANGFIGACLTTALSAAGHETIIGVHQSKPSYGSLDPDRFIHVDLTRDVSADWIKRLEGVDAVINAAGAMTGDLEALHARGPIALFDACARLGIGHVIQISALGADISAETWFLRSKAKADAHLCGLREKYGFSGWCVLRPSLVLGRGGGSMAQFSALAALPYPPRLAEGAWRVQPLHVTDLAAAVLMLLLPDIEVPAKLNLVGPEEMTTDQLTGLLRGWLGLPPARLIPIRESVLAIAAGLGRLLPNAAWRPETMAMLRRGNTADPAPAQTYGIQIRPIAEALAHDPATQADLVAARMAPLLPIIRSALAFVWIGSGVIPITLTPEPINQNLLTGLGLNQELGRIVLYAGAALDVAIGLALLFWRRPATWFLLGQVGIILLLTLLASLAAPQAWLDPFAPLLKNLAILAASFTLLGMRR
jgi:uncharacterized protein YbjT (DUF2867 family)